MNAVGIDISKGKSTVTIRRPGDIVVMPPCDIPHTQSAMIATKQALASIYRHQTVSFAGLLKMECQFYLQQHSAGTFGYYHRR